jgi:type II secretion system protein C
MRRLLIPAVALLASSVLAAQDDEALRLVGTMKLSQAAAGPSHAVFETEDGRQVIVNTGEEIHGCLLVSVGARRVEMECADGLVSVALRSNLRARSEPMPHDQMIYEVTLPRDAFLEVLQDRQRVARQLSLEPAVSEGWLYGYRVSWVESGGEFHRLGLRAEDVIVSLNGVPASTPGPFMQALDGLRGQTSFQLTLQRSGELIGYSYLLE